MSELGDAIQNELRKEGIVDGIVDAIKTKLTSESTTNAEATEQLIERANKLEAELKETQTRLAAIEEKQGVVEDIARATGVIPTEETPTPDTKEPAKSAKSAKKQKS